MPATNPTTIKLTDAEKARLDELCRLHGTPGQPMSLIGVIRRLIWTPHPSETLNGVEKKTSGKSRNRS